MDDLGIYHNGNWYDRTGNLMGPGKFPAVSVVANALAAFSNSDAINAQLALGGKVEIPQDMGDIYIGKSLIVPSYTEFRTGAGTRLKRISTNGSWQMVRNKYAQNGCYVNGLTISGGIFTMPEPGHSHQVGDQVYTEGFTGNLTLNGVKTVASVVPGVSWTFAASGGNPTNTSTQLAFVSIYNSLAGANVSRTSNVMTVLEAGHTRGLGDAFYIAGLGGTNTFNGAGQILDVTPGVSWTAVNTGVDETATGTGILLGDRCIVTDLELDGNSGAISASQWGAHATCWINVSKSQSTVRDARYTQFGRVVAGYNCTDFDVPLMRGSKANGVGVQFDSFCDRITVGNVVGLSFVDDMLAWGVTNNTGAFGDTASPTGPGSMGTLTCGALLGNSVTGIFKSYAFTGYDAGRMKIGRIKGDGPVTIGDSTTGVGGGTITELSIDDLNNRAVLATTNLIGFTSGFSNIAQVNIGRFVDTPLTAADTGYGIYIGCPITNLAIKQRIMTTARTVRGISVEAAVGTLSIDRDQPQADGASGTSIMCAAGGVVTNFIAGNVSHSSPTNNQGFYIFSQSGGTVANLFIANFKGAKGGAIYTNTTAGVSHNVHIGNVNVDLFASGLNSSVADTWNVFANNVKATNTGNNFFQFSGCTARIVGRGINCYTDSGATRGKYILAATTGTISVDGADIRVDLGASAGAPPAGFAPLSGDMLTNTNATGGGIYARTAAGAWQLVA